MNRYYPTMRQLIHAVIIGIASHPKIKNPGIFYPIQVEGSNSQILIEQYRAYGGYELENPGLCCSVYPAYSSRTTQGSSPLVVTKERSIKYTDYTLGNKFEDGAINFETYTIVVELTYQDVAFGPTYEIFYDSIDPIDPFRPLETPHGYNIEIKNNSTSNLDNNLQSNSLSPNEIQLTQNNKVEFLINPAEELLREYLPLMKLVLDDLPSIRPYLIRTSRVTSVDFPTSAWSRSNPDIYFHSAYLTWELTLYPPTNFRQVSFLPPRQITLNPTIVNPASINP